jgi:hypothetical protein
VIHETLRPSLRYFHQAADHLTWPAASSAVRMATRSGNTTATASSPPSYLMANRLGPKSLMANSALPMARRSALTTMSAGVTPIVPIPREYEHTSALSVVPDHIMLSLGSAVPVLPPINSSPLTIITEPLSYHDFSDSIVHRNLHRVKLFRNPPFW